MNQFPLKLNSDLVDVSTLSQPDVGSDNGIQFLVDILETNINEITNAYQEYNPTLDWLLSCLKDKRYDEINPDKDKFFTVSVFSDIQTRYHVSSFNLDGKIAFAIEHINSNNLTYKSMVIMVEEENLYIETFVFI